jgi:hypothetical protein
MNYNNLTRRHFENPSHAGRFAEGPAEGLAERHTERLVEEPAEGLAERLADKLADGPSEGRAGRLAEGATEGLAEGPVEGLAEGRREEHAGRLAEGPAEGLAGRLREGHAVGFAGRRIWRGAAGSRAQGTWVQFEVQISAADSRSAERTLILESVRFLAYACPHVIAVADWVAEQSTGKPALPALPESVQALRRRFEVPIEKLGRLLIVEDAWRAALSSASSGSAADS